jgi:hypothetical protein
VASRNEYQAIEYRGEQDALWRGDFAGIYAALFDELQLMVEVHVPYLEGGNVDSMFMLEKGAS